MSAFIHIGTSGWSYDHWKSVLYPKSISGSDMLSSYAKHFSTVEINGTFYRLPSKKTVEEWKKAVPDDFCFAIKASRYITHQKKLNDPKESIEKFFERVELLDKKLGPILFQLPPNWHKNRERLEAFIKALPRSYHYVFEFRDPSWFDTDIVGLLEETGNTFCIYDMEGEESPLHITSDIIYIRLHGPGAKYQGSYTKKLLKVWVDRFNKWIKKGKEIYCYFNNDYEGHAPKNAKLLQEMFSTVTNSR